MNQCRYLALACLYENLNISKFFFFSQNPTISVKNPQLNYQTLATKARCTKQVTATLYLIGSLEREYCFRILWLTH